uniref:Uncharacterized protein n=1 Tax=Brassica campestris TaxID=3711 RepID=M4DZQ0_BRACM
MHSGSSIKLDEARSRVQVSKGCDSKRCHWFQALAEPSGHPRLHSRTVRLTGVLCRKGGKSKSGRSRKIKEAAGQSSQVAADGTNPTGLPTNPVVANTGGELPTDPANLTGTHQGNEEGQQHQEGEEEVESSNANRDGDRQEVAADGTAKQAAALFMKDMLEAMKVMGNQVVAMTHLFTLLVNSSVGQATPVATATPVADGPAVETAEVVEINPPLVSHLSSDLRGVLRPVMGRNEDVVFFERGTTPSEVENVDPVGSDSRTETLPTGPTNTGGTAGITKTQRIPPIGASNQDRASGHDQSSPSDRTSVKLAGEPSLKQDELKDAEPVKEKQASSEDMWPFIPEQCHTNLMIITMEDQLA